ncbi:adenine deaminase [Metabacillus sp. RGM 3146]|uniref:adenine deaminase n=1 Tax=Metabacillus sp. RGM 3146 TaxID=3401092 RepID=UPI003B9C4120
MDNRSLGSKIYVSAKRQKADLLIKNAKIIDVFNREIFEGHVAVAEGTFAGFGEFEASHIVDAKGAYLAPSFIDSHVHIESSMVKPSEFAKVVLTHGVTTVVTDPHEIANVSGAEGIQYMLDESEGLELEVYVMLPSSVPAASFEYNGAELKAFDLEPFYQHPRVLGLAEVMDFPSVRDEKADMMEKLVQARKKKAMVDGHMAGFSPEMLDIYGSAGIRTDHEVSRIEEVHERIRRGMYVQIRHGSAAKDLPKIIHAVNKNNARRFLFCTDDKHLNDLIQEGSVDHNVRLSIELGIDPIIAIQIASLNAAECYGLRNKGGIAPGYDADFILFNDLENISIQEVYKKGVCVSKNGTYLVREKKTRDINEKKLTSTIHCNEISVSELKIPLPDKPSATIIEIEPNQLVTKKIVENVLIKEGHFIQDPIRDQLKLVLAERHHNTGIIGLGIVKGLGLKKGAIAASVSHDSHNLIAAGCHDEDIALALNHLRCQQGGLAVSLDGKILASLALPIAGLISNENAETVSRKLELVQNELLTLGAGEEIDLFLTLSFLGLPVIPEIKLTVEGLFDVLAFKHISI